VTLSPQEALPTGHNAPRQLAAKKFRRICKPVLDELFGECSELFIDLVAFVISHDEIFHAVILTESRWLSYHQGESVESIDSFLDARPSPTL
jgi:hypothetical protein